MSAKSGATFFFALGQRHAALGRPMSRETKTSGKWPEWAKRAYFLAYTSATIFKRTTNK